MGIVITDIKAERFVDTTFTGGKNRLCVDASLIVKDIQIGAVEIKDSITDERAEVRNNKLETYVSLSNGVFIQQPPKTKVEVFVGQQVNTNVLTPTAGKRLKIFGVQVDSSATNSCCAKINFVNDTGTLVWKVYFDKAKGVQGWMPINITGETDQSLVLNTVDFNTTTEIFLSVAYEEVD